MLSVAQNDQCALQSFLMCCIVTWFLQVVRSVKAHFQLQIPDREAHVNTLVLGLLARAMVLELLKDQTQ